MTHRLQSLLIVGCIYVLLGGHAVHADVDVLGLFVGHWDIKAQTLQPEPASASYSERYEWVLDSKFVRGETGRKADGSKDIIYGTFDPQADGYPFWIFSSSGSYLYLPPATWDAGRQTMEWKNPKGLDINYHSRCHFPDRNNRHCNLIMKDWKGAVMLELQWHAIRRDD